MVNRFDDPGLASLQKELTDTINARPGPIMDAMPEHEAQALLRGHDKILRPKRAKRLKVKKRAV